MWPHGECDHVLGGWLQDPGELRVDASPLVHGVGSQSYWLWDWWWGVPESGVYLLVSE